MTVNLEPADQMFARLSESAKREKLKALPDEHHAEVERAAQLLIDIYGVHALQAAAAIEQRAQMSDFAIAVRKAVARRLTEFNRV